MKNRVHIFCVSELVLTNTSHEAVCLHIFGLLTIQKTASFWEDNIIRQKIWNSCDRLLIAISERQKSATYKLGGILKCNFSRASLLYIWPLFLKSKSLGSLWGSSIGDTAAPIMQVPCWLFTGFQTRAPSPFLPLGSFWVNRVSLPATMR